MDPQATGRALEKDTARTESPFEREVLERLIARGYRVRPQWWVGRYRIDLVVEGGGKRLAVECDGDRYHPIEKLQEDMERQAILERLGWRFVRLRGTEFFRDRDATMEKVFERLRQLEIPPDGAAEQREAPESCDILELVKRRAAQIRDEWQAEVFREDLDEWTSETNNVDNDRDDLPLFEAARADKAPDAAAVFVIERGNSNGDGRADTSTKNLAVDCDVVITGEARIEIWRMTRGDFHRYKESILPLNEIDRQAINREYAAAIRKALSEGKEVPHETLRELGIAQISGT